VILGIALTVLAIVSLAALVAGVILMVNPAGFGVGNAIGVGVTTAAIALNGLIVKAGVLIAANTLITTIAGAAGLGVVVVTAAIADAVFLSNGLAISL
jgi:hypothetical protein